LLLLLRARYLEISHRTRFSKPRVSLRDIARLILVLVWGAFIWTFLQEKRQKQMYTYQKRKQFSLQEAIDVRQHFFNSFKRPKTRMRKNRACALGSNRWHLRSLRLKKIVYSVAIILIILWKLCLNKQTRKPTLTCLGCLSIHIYSIAVLFGLSHKSPKVAGFRIWWVLVLVTCGAINFQSVLVAKGPCPRSEGLSSSVFNTLHALPSFTGS